MRRNLIFIFVVLWGFVGVNAQPIRVNPTGVNVNSQNPTVVFLTFGQIPAGYISADAVWCGQIIPAPPPALGSRCHPATIYGALPARYDLSQASGNRGLTDIMSIPASVARRAYQSALEGGDAGFFYVRRFVSNSGQPDQYVNVTCRMTGGGARVPFALTNVEIQTGSNEPVLFVGPKEKFEKLSAQIQYNGTGRLKGRWELVRPGEEPPGDFDLLTEGSLPLEERGSQKRYLQITRFNHFLPPGGKFTLPLEVTQLLPIQAEGQYLLLLRIEASEDKESDSDLRVIGVGDTVVHSGAVAGFPMPVLKFFVSSKSASINWESDSLLSPNKDFVLNNDQPVMFQWRQLPDAATFRLEIYDDNDTRLFSAILTSLVTSYEPPSWFRTRFSGRLLKWRVIALDEKAGQISASSQRTIQIQ